MYYLQNNGRYLRNNGVLLNNKNISYGLKVFGNTEHVVAPSIIPIGLNTDYSFAISYIRRASSDLLGVPYSPIFNKTTDLPGSNGLLVYILGNVFSVLYVQNWTNNLVQYYIISPKFAIGNLVHVVWNNTERMFYLDGEPVTPILSTNGVTPTYISNEPITFGEINTGLPPYAEMDFFDFKLFNRDLTQLEITDLAKYNRVTSNLPNMLAWFPFNDIFNDGNNKTTEKVANNHGVLTNYTLGQQPIIDINNNPVTQYTI